MAQAAEETPADLVAFCRHAHPRLVGVLGLYLGDVAVAEELAQETLIQTARRWSDPLHDPDAFAYRVAMNMAASHARRRRAERRAMARLAGQSSPDVHHDPDTAAVLAVREHLSRLPARQRQVVALRHGAQLTVEETADLLGMSRDAVRSSCKRALARLRSELQLLGDAHALREEVGDV